jgi:predicted nucleic acid-binding protein
LAITSTLGVLTAAAEKTLLDLPTAVAALRKTTFRAPAGLLDKILKADEKRRGAGPD